MSFLLSFLLLKLFAELAKEKTEEENSMNLRNGKSQNIKQ